MAHPPKPAKKLRTAYIGGLSLEIAAAQAWRALRHRPALVLDAKASGDNWTSSAPPRSSSPVAASSKPWPASSRPG